MQTTPRILAFGWRIAPLMAALPSGAAHGQGVEPAGAVPAPMPALFSGVTTVPVLPGEFRLQAYDTERGMISVSLPAELSSGKPGGLRYRMRGSASLLVPVPPGLLNEVVEAERNGRVELDVSVEALPAAPANAPDRPDDMVDARPTWVRLNIERNPVAEAAVGLPTGGGQSPRPAAIQVGPLRGESRGFTAAAERKFADATLRVANRCALQAGAHVPSIRGALQVELERSPVGERRRPQVVLDLTVCNRLVDCLTDGLATDDDVWSVLDDGDRAWVPIYFKGAPEAGTVEAPAVADEGGGSGPAVNGSVAP